MKNMKRFLVVLVLTGIILGSLASCGSLGGYTILIDNRHTAPMDTYYRAAGETEWQQLELGIPSGYQEYVDLPEGTYDFTAVPSGFSGPDSFDGNEVEESVDLDYHYNYTDESQSYDYDFIIYADDSILVL